MSEPIKFTALGGACEIGANSYLLELGELRILLDCGSDVPPKN